MKYLLFGFDSYYPSGNNLIATSDNLDVIIKYAESHTYTYWANGKPKRYDEYEVYELLDGVGHLLVWTNGLTSLVGDIVKVDFL